MSYELLVVLKRGVNPLGEAMGVRLDPLLIQSCWWRSTAANKRSQNNGGCVFSGGLPLDADAPELMHMSQPCSETASGPEAMLVQLRPFLITLNDQGAELEQKSVFREKLKGPELEQECT